MPRVADIYQRPPGIDAVTNATIDSSDYNLNVADVETDLNTPRPIVAGGTGATSAAGARDNLDAEVAGKQVINYDTHVWEQGSFYSLSSATSPPAGLAHAFAGIVYGVIDATTPANSKLVMEARDLDDTTSPGLNYVREKIGTAAWSAWSLADSGAYVLKSGDTMTGDLNIGKAQPQLVLNKSASGTHALVTGATAGSLRWAIALGNNAAEAAGNVGSDFYIFRYNDAGTVVDNPISIIRSTGNVFTNVLYSTSFNVAGITNFGVYSASSHRFYQFNTNQYMYLSATDNYIYCVNAVPIWRAQPDGNFVSLVPAYKPGGGVWGDSSDARIKNVEGEYTRGLDDVVQLRPVYYTFKGNDTDGAPVNYSVPHREGEPLSKDEATVPYPNSPHYKPATERKRFAGLIAQEVETVFPEMVTKRTAMIDGQPVTDMRDLDTTALLFALVNSVKTLMARIEALEAAQAAP